MECPYLKYEDGGWASYEFFCKATGQKVGDQNNKVKVEYTCRDSHFYDCPVYRKMKY